MISTVQQLIDEKLKPHVRKIDADAYYAREYLTACGKHDLFCSEGMIEQDYLLNELQFIEQTAKVCMTTAFNLWCHFAALTYVRKSNNSYLKKEILPLLENGQLQGGTGLSNPMKYYAGLEELHLKAEKTDGGYYISGTLPSVSNLGANHWFGVIAELSTKQQIMVFLPCHSESLKMKEKTSFLGLNGSATFACQFNNVFIPHEWVLSEEADMYIQRIRPLFLLYQIPLGLGVIDASIQSMYHVQHKQRGANHYLKIQPDELEHVFHLLQEKTYALASASNLTEHWLEIIKLRLEVTYLTSKAVHANMLHHGGAGYLQHSAPSRRLREGYFLVNLTPTISHLEKMLQQ